MSMDQPPPPLVKSRQRVSDHGEVFTPDWMVQAMLDQVDQEASRIGSRFLEPACGDGNFLGPVLRRKLMTVEKRYGSSEFERAHQALYALMSIYGIELLPDNAEQCRSRLLAMFTEFVGAAAGDEWKRAGAKVLATNIVLGDAMSMHTPDGAMIQFAEWAYLGKGKFQRRDFRLDELSQRSRIQDTLFDHLDEHDVFTATKAYPPLTVKNLAA